MRGLFAMNGVHTVVDGQFGSTGKGVLAAWLASQSINGERNIPFAGVISNAGPNSGHTYYHEGEKVVLKQLPTFASALYKMGKTAPVFLSAGAIIDPDILRKEALEHPGMPIFVHANAAVITQQDKDSEHSGTVAAVAGTRSGTGAAIARKVLRDPSAVVGAYQWDWDMPTNVVVLPEFHIHWDKHRYFMEVSQGFSLGINQPFYPKCTSRECTVSQALADAGLPPRASAKTYMSMRTYPIRVGNVDGHSSGEWYSDQRETTWEQLGQVPELTTVTQRVRRVASFSHQQMERAVRANDPDFVFMNFMNYIDPSHQVDFMEELVAHRNGRYNFILGYGPESKDVKLV